MPRYLGQVGEPETSQPDNTHDARLSRVFDYQTSSLQNEDPLEANLGSINRGLMRIAICLDKTIAQALESERHNAERLARVSPAIDTYLRVVPSRSVCAPRAACG